MHTTISTRFDADTLTRLDQVAVVMHRLRSALIKEAVIRYLDYPRVIRRGSAERSGRYRCRTGEKPCSSERPRSRAGFPC
jgi:predicted transcriptional regulator